MHQRIEPGGGGHEQDADAGRRGFAELPKIPADLARHAVLLQGPRRRDRTAFPAPALVLFDLKLAGMDGHDVLCWIRAQPVWRSRVVVVLTTSRERSDVQKAYANGANAYLVKPSAAQVRALKAFWFEQNGFAVPGV